MRLAARQRSRGFTLIDVVVVIVVMGVMAATITTLAGRMAEQSARTVKTRQMLVVAQSLLEEIKQMPYTFCDATTRAANAPACGASIDNLGIELGETRYNVANRFDGVTDYHLFSMSGGACAGLCDIDGNVLNPAGSPLSGCDAAVLLAQVAMNGIPAAQVLRIRVSVTCPGTTDPIFVEGIRVRHAPNNF